MGEAKRRSRRSFEQWPLRTDSRPLLCIDLDGVLTRDWRRWVAVKERRPHWGNIRRMRVLWSLGGYRLWVWSMRGREERRAIVAWLRRHRVPYHRLVTNKLRYALLVDDRATPRVPLPGARFRFLSIPRLVR